NVIVTPQGRVVPTSKMRLVALVGSSLNTPLTLLPRTRNALPKFSAKPKMAGVVSVEFEICVTNPAWITPAPGARVLRATPTTALTGAAGGEAAGNGRCSAGLLHGDDDHRLRRAAGREPRLRNGVNHQAGGAVA